jgi:hypothetical protein
MSIKIIKKGLSDRIIDQGRYGYQDLGIQPSGPMDYVSAQLANAILENELNHPVFELHFPAAVFEFETTMFNSEITLIFHQLELSNESNLIREKVAAIFDSIVGIGVNS